MTAHGRQRVECWFFWLQQAWPDAGSPPAAATVAASASAGQALPAESPLCDIAGPALPWGVPVAAPAPLPLHQGLDAAHAEAAPGPRLDAGSAGAAAGSAGSAPGSSGQPLSAKPRGKSMPLLARPLALGLPAGAAAAAAPAASRTAPPGDSGAAGQRGSLRCAAGGGGAAADAFAACAPWGSAAGRAVAQSWAGSAAAATRAGRPWTGAAGLAASLAALVAFPPPYDAERARREARARSTSQPLTLGARWATTARQAV